MRLHLLGLGRHGVEPCSPQACLYGMSLAELDVDQAKYLEYFAWAFVHIFS